METVAETAPNPALAKRLERALAGRRPFRRFKDVPYDVPAERERWFAFGEQRRRRRIDDWLTAEGVLEEGEFHVLAWPWLCARQTNPARTLSPRAPGS